MFENDLDRVSRNNPDADDWYPDGDEYGADTWSQVDVDGESIIDEIDRHTSYTPWYVKNRYDALIDAAISEHMSELRLRPDRR